MGDEYVADEDLEQDIDYQAELVKLAIAELLLSRMEQMDISRSELARRMNVSRARVTQILAGYANLTVSTMAAAAAALGTKVSVELIPTAPSSVATPADRKGQPTLPPPRRSRRGRAVATA